MALQKVCLYSGYFFLKLKSVLVKNNFSCITTEIYVPTGVRFLCKAGLRTVSIQSREQLYGIGLSEQDTWLYKVGHSEQHTWLDRVGHLQQDSWLYRVGHSEQDNRLYGVEHSQQGKWIVYRYLHAAIRSRAPEIPMSHFGQHVY